jgi:hypothetical protein
VDADPHLHLVVTDLEGRRAGGRHRTTGERDAHGRGRRVDPIAERLAGGEIGPALGRRADDLLDDHRARDPAAAGGIGRVLHGDVVVGEHARMRARHHLRGYLEVHDVAGVVLDDEQDARASVDRRGRGQHLIRRGRGEHLTRTGGIEHAMADEAGMQRLVAGAPAGNQRHLLAHKPPSARDEGRVTRELDQIGMRRGEAFETLGQDAINGVHQLLH